MTRWRCLLLLSMCGCGEPDVTAPTGRLTVLPAGEVRVAVGASRILQAVFVDGETTTTAAPRWVDDGGGAISVNGAGEVIGLSPGAGTVTAIAGDQEASLPVSCVARAYTHIEVEPLVLEVLPSGSGEAQAVGYDVDGIPQVISDVVSWSTEDPSVATVDGDGAVFGVALGRTQLVADWYGVFAATAVEVTTEISTPGNPDAPDTPAQPVEAQWTLSLGEALHAQMDATTDPLNAALGTCGQGLFHFWFSAWVHEPEAPKRVRGYANITVIRPDPRTVRRPVILGFGEDVAIAAARVELPGPAQGWFDREIEVRLDLAEHGVVQPEPGTFVLKDHVTDASCCRPCVH